VRVFDGRSGSRAAAQAVNAAEEAAAAGTPHIYALDVAATRAYLRARYVHSPKRRGKPSALNPKPKTQNPKPKTQNPQTLNPKP